MPKSEARYQRKVKINPKKSLRSVKKHDRHDKEKHVPQRPSEVKQHALKFVGKPLKAGDEIKSECKGK